MLRRLLQEHLSVPVDVTFPVEFPKLTRVVLTILTHRGIQRVPGKMEECVRFVVMDVCVCLSPTHWRTVDGGWVEGGGKKEWVAGRLNQ